jgi:hypothetical protein
VSRDDVTNIRKVWSYVEDNLKPDYDFEEFDYLQRTDQMWEIKRMLDTEDARVVRSYKEKSTSYFLIDSDDKISDLKNQGVESALLTADDKDGAAVQVTLTFQITNQFY